MPAEQGREQTPMGVDLQQLSLMLAESYVQFVGRSA
jgi:hypothetical protein